MSFPFNVRKCRPLFVTTLLIASIMVIAGVIGSARSTSAASAVPGISTDRAQNIHVNQPEDPLCDLNWRVVPSPNTSSAYNALGRLAAVSPNDIWAVGSSDGGRQTLTMHWDGQQWTIIPSPNPATDHNYLEDVDAVASNNVWAVGTSWDITSPSYPLIIHWNGTSWSQVGTSAFGELYAIDAISANDIWAAGTDGLNPLMLHWNGSSWSQVDAPPAGDMWNRPQSIKAVSTNNVWAVGYYRTRETGTLEKAYVLHWDGVAWSLIPSPVPNSPRNFLYGVAPVAANDVWAVGDYYDPSVGGTLLIMHWNGTTWSVVPGPAPAEPWTYLADITAISANNIWAVGHYLDGASRPYTLVIHWEGTSWTRLTGVAESGYASGIDDLSSTNMWFVGTNSANETLTEHYSTDCPLPTFTPVPTNTRTPVPPSPTHTRTPLPTYTPTFAPPRCPGERFTDVCPGDYFYEPVLALSDDNIISGYNTWPPCVSPLQIPCFKPYSNVTRGQVAKIVSLAAGFNEPVSGQTFEDVPTSQTFYQYIERMASRGVINGYPCSWIGEPCVPPLNRPYFRPNNSVTRGQLTKMISIAFDFNEPVSGQSFEDVPAGSTYHEYIQRMTGRGIISGYPCGGSSEPCVPPGNRPYFRPNNPVTRGQTAKIVYLAREQITPTVTPTTTSTTTPTVTSTPTTIAPPTDTPTPEATSTP